MKLSSTIVRLDRRGAKLAVTVGSFAVRHWLARLSNAANHGKLWSGVAGAMALGGGRRGRRAAQRGMLALAVSSALANGLLKLLFRRRRPPVNPETAHILPPPKSTSFPSGHAASAAAFATATAMEAPAASVPVAALAASVAYSRISSGVHYPTDVLAGVAVGAGVAAATTKVWPLIDPEPAEAPPVFPWSTTVANPNGDGLTVIANAAAGPSAHKDQLDTIAKLLPEARLLRVEDPSRLDDAFESAARYAKALGVIGGDGTIGAAAAVAIDNDLPLAVFPGGTLNHFARDVGIDDVNDTCEAVATGKLIEVDTATIDGRTFLNTASFGTYSEFVETRERYENRLGKWPAMVVALSSVLRNSEPTSIQLNGANRKVWMIFIGNCEYDPPGFAPATRNSLNDGRLDCRYVDGTTPGSRFRLAAAVLTGQLNRSRIYTRELVEKISIDTNTDQASLAADGEVFTGSGRFVVKKNELRLKIYAPHR